eukprot:TRINITY_DN2184_c0_g1_i8.p2 TRINITY_DN2184_c0_g1~~TRINITY_DN2184_c0_g1_i8.p2  ORF type:complete len:168 (+),score=21.38 TRINITY_DN2184_c0_g1_i8:76-579(+)
MSVGSWPLAGRIAQLLLLHLAVLQTHVDATAEDTCLVRTGCNDEADSCIASPNAVAPSKAAAAVGSDNVLLQTERRKKILASRATCCSGCNGKPFCSPNSGNCYDTKRKSYYETCEANPQPAPAPPGTGTQVSTSGVCRVLSAHAFQVLVSYACSLDLFGRNILGIN